MIASPSRFPSARSTALALIAAAGCYTGTLVAPVSTTPPRPPVRAQPLAPTAEIEGITEYRLANGLKVVLFPDPSISTITLSVTYRVGSRHEGPGEAGMAHLLEHMLFKSTAAFPSVKTALTERGAQWNGTTSNDRTNYFETLPAGDENLEFALRLEAERMVKCNVSAEDLSTEMTVVRNEFERSENSPNAVLSQRMLATAYLFHGYGRPTIGNQSDIERVPAANLKRFYAKYYQPDNAMLVVAGRFERARTLERIQQAFGPIPRPDRVLEEPYTVEPPQDGPRSVVLRRAGSNATAALAYHIPAGSHADAAALAVLGRVLSDAPSGKLYKALVQTKKAASVSAFGDSSHDPGLFTIRATLPVGQDPEALQRQLIDEVEKVTGSVKADEVERARNRFLKEYRQELASSRQTALDLSEYEAMGDWRLLFVGRDQLAKVSVDDVNRVARTYLIASNRTAGIFRPTTDLKRAEIPEAPDVAALLKSYRGSSAAAAGESFEATAANIERSTKRTRSAGIDLAMLPKKTRGELVQGRIRLGYGTAKSLAGRETAAALMPTLMLRGTAKHSYQQIRDALDALETDLSVSSRGAGTLDVSLRTTRSHLSEALALVGEILRQPSFPAPELEIVRQQLLTGYESQRTDPQSRMSNALSRALAPYPKTSVLYRPTLDEQIERARKLQRSAIAELHHRFLGAEHAEASFVGDFDPAELQKALGAALGGWKSAEKYERVEVPYVAIEAREETIDTPDKKMAAVARGAVLRLRSDDPDYPALAFANYVLGEGSKSRLWTALREQGGLSYSVSSDLQVSDENEVSYLTAAAIAAPQNARKAQTLLRDAFQRWLSEPIAASELEAFRGAYVERFRNALSDDASVASALLTDVHLKRPFTVRQQLIDTAVQLTPEQIQRAIRAHLSDSPFVDFAAGDTSKFNAAPDAAPAGAPTSGAASGRPGGQ